MDPKRISLAYIHFHTLAFTRSLLLSLAHFHFNTFTISLSHFHVHTFTFTLLLILSLSHFHNWMNHITSAAATMIPLMAARDFAEKLPVSSLQFKTCFRRFLFHYLRFRNSSYLIFHFTFILFPFLEYTLWLWLVGQQMWTIWGIKWRHTLMTPNVLT